jgi:membrane protein
LQSFLPVIRRFLSFIIAFLVIFLTYRFVPVKKPTTISSLIGALWCALAIILLQMLFFRFFRVTPFNVIYGVLGSLILMVLWVHFCFVLFFFFAEYVFVSDKIDILVLERMYFFRLKQDVKGKKIERFLFRHPKRIFEKYARRYKTGETIFQQGDRGTDIYFIYSGSIGISRTNDGIEHTLATLEEGEVFGEMAYLLNESRTATATANTDSVLIVIMPDAFEELLQVNTTFSRNVIQLLTDRLRKTHLPEKP